MKKNLILSALILCCFLSVGFGQPSSWSIANGHAHNDYQHNIPFLQAYGQGFGSIEVDVLLHHDTLFVGHVPVDIKNRVVFEKAYVQPLWTAVQQNQGYVYADTARKLQLLIDLKTEAVPTLQAVIKSMEKYPALCQNTSIRFVITGNQPQNFSSYPSYILFDGNLSNPDHVKQADRIALFSASFRRYSNWNGKGVLPAHEHKEVEQLIAKAHALHKPFRFWAVPDNINTWYKLIGWGVDYINTDRVEAFAAFMKNYKTSSAKTMDPYPVYTPEYKVDRVDKPVKNIIFLIGDGTGLAQWYAGYTTNKGQLNVFNMRSIGLSKTSASDSYNTDSGAGATAMATGEKTNNRFIATDPQGRSLTSITKLVAEKGIRTAILTTGDVTDATPAAFYSHVRERSESEAIAADFLKSGVDILIGSGARHFWARKDQRDLGAALQEKKYSVLTLLDHVDTVKATRVVVLDSMAGKHVDQGRGAFLQKALEFTLQKLKNNKEGFFVMAEGAQVDHGAHANNLSWMVQEVHDLDRAIGAAMRFVDENKETLLIVTADHETGGLSLLDGDITQGRVGGQFATDDHSGICVPVFAYGPQSTLFCGVYENTAIFHKIRTLLLEQKK